MPRPPIDLHQKIRELLQHTVALPPESAAPLAHYEWSTNEVFNLMAYVRSHLERTPVYERVYNRHMSQLRRLALVSLVESFERLLKELAALCIDNLVSYVADDRFEKMGVSGGQIAAHFGAGTVGKALSESDTWLTNRTINERFRSLLKSPFGDSWEEFLFPDQGQKPPDERANAATLAILWQVRHTLTHNVGVITRSDGIKLRLLLRHDLQTDCVLAPDEADLRYIKQFLSGLAQTTNRRVATRIAWILTELHQQSPGIFDAQAKADSLSRHFGLPLTVDTAGGSL